MFILTKDSLVGFSVCFIHGEPNELAGLPLWLGSKELFYFKNTVISFVCTWVGGRVGVSSRR